MCGFAVADALRGEHYAVAVQASGARSGLIPDHPGDAILNSVLRPRERDVRLDPIARGIDVQAWGERRRPEPSDAGLLPAEAANRRHVATEHYPGRRHAVAVREPRALRALNEDLVRVADRPRRRRGSLLPGDPWAGLRRVDRRAACHRRVLGILVGVDVQRRNRDAAAAGATTLPREDPSALIGVADVVEAAGEDIVVGESRSSRVLIPGGPRNRATCSREVDRRSLAVLPLVEVQRAAEYRTCARAPADRTAASRAPRPFRERAHKRLVVTPRGGGLTGDSPRRGHRAARQRAADDVRVGWVLAADAERAVDPDGRVVIDLCAGRQRLKRDRRSGSRQDNERTDHGDPDREPPPPNPQPPNEMPH